MSVESAREKTNGPVCASEPFTKLLTQYFNVGFLQVGVNVNLDASHLFKDYNVDVANDSAIRLSH